MSAAVAVALPCHDALNIADLERACPFETSRVERRAAFDIGSGTSKLLVTDVDVQARRCLRQVYAREIPVLYGVDLQRSDGRALSDRVQEEGIRVLRELLDDAGRFKAQAVVGVATEVFRRAANGADFVSRIQRETGLCVKVVDQSIEALLGFRTAGAMSSIPHKRLIMWDCGGGSFQLVKSGGHRGRMQMHLGRFGDSVATAMLMELQGKSMKSCSSPNPVSLQDAQKLLDQLSCRLPAGPLWLEGSEGVVAIGGRNSMFFLLADMINRGAVDARLGTCRADSEGCPESAEITAEAARAALAEVSGRCDDELSRAWCWRTNSDPPSMVVPKLCLIIASMESFGIQSFRWCRTVGSCPGIATSESTELGCVGM